MDGDTRPIDVSHTIPYRALIMHIRTLARSSSLRSAGFVALALSVPLFPACSDSDDDNSKQAEDWAAGDYPPDVQAQSYLTLQGVKGQNGAVRGYKVHVPASYQKDVATPLVFALHGLGQNAVMFNGSIGANWIAKSDQAGFILVMPNGNVQNSDGSWATIGSWNAGECCGSSAQGGLDDVELIRAIAKEVDSHLNVDLKRVYASGLSNGGFLSFRLACEAADLITAIAPGSGAIGDPNIAPLGQGNHNFTSCNPSRAVPVLAFHGTADPLVSYDYMKPSLDRFAQANGCQLTTTAAATPATKGDTSCVTYQGCPAGIEVTGCTVAGGGHCWFGSSTCGTGDTSGIGAALVGKNSDSLVNTDAAWDFLKRFTK